MPPDRRDRWKLAFMLALGAALTVALLVFERPRTQVWGALFNVSHVVLAGAMTLAARWTVATWWPASSAFRRYGAALAFTVVAGAALEIAQFVAPGSPSGLDLVRDTAGAVAAVLLHLAYAHRHRARALGLAAAALLVLAPALWPGARAVLHFARIVRQLPAVAAFEGPGDAAELRAMDGGAVAVTPPPTAWAQATRARVGRVTFAAGYENPRILINNPFADWSDYRALVFTLYSPEERPLPVMLRIDDMDATTAMSDRFHRRLLIQPGHNELRISLAEVRDSPQRRSLDLAALENVVLYMERPSEDHTLFVERFWLE